MKDLIVFREAGPEFLLNSTIINVLLHRVKESSVFTNHVDVIVEIALRRLNDVTDGQ